MPRIALLSQCWWAELTSLKWTEKQETLNLSTLRCLEKSVKTSRNMFSWKGWFPARTLHNNIRERLKVFASSTAEFDKMLAVIEESTTPREEESPLENSKYSPVFAGEGEESPDYPSRVNEELHDVLSFHVSFCSSQHITRLRLNLQDCVQENEAICFEMLFSSQRDFPCPSIATEWKETKMFVPRYHQNLIIDCKLSMHS